MIPYLKERSGLARRNNEDNYCIRKFHDEKKREFGLFAVADGCSGYEGAEASRIAVAGVRKHIETRIRNQPEGNHETAIREGILAINEDLIRAGESRGTGLRTTLDLVLVSPQSYHLAHLGDGKVYLVFKDSVKQATLDESSRGEPTNYLGSIYLEGSRKHIKDRINIIRPEIGPQDINYIFLATDGLDARATEEQILGGLRKLGPAHPQEVLEEFLQICLYPKEKMMQQPMEKLKFHFLAGVQDFPIKESATKEELVELLLSCYENQENPEIVRRMNGGMEFGVLKSDDTTLLIVDREDYLGKKQREMRGRLETAEKDLRKAIQETIPKLENEKRELNEKYATAVEENERLRKKIKEKRSVVKEGWDSIRNLFEDKP